MISSAWRRITSPGGTPVPASRTTKFTASGALAAARGAAMPPSLCPIRPTHPPAMSGRARSSATPASASCAKSAVVERDTRAGRATHAAVVGAQHRHAGAGQVVGQHQEGLVGEQLLVAVLRAAAGQQHRGREGPRSLRERQRAGQRDVAVAVGRLFGAVGERRLRFLGTLGRRSGLAPEAEGEGHPVLGEVAGQPAVGEQAAEGERRRGPSRWRTPGSRPRPARSRAACRSPLASGCRWCRTRPRRPRRGRP